MATYNKFQCFVEDLGLEKHQLSTDELRVYLSNATPDANLDTIKSDLAEITAANGYNNADVTNTWIRTAGVVILAGADVLWTAAAGNFGPFRYVVLFNANSDANLANCALIAWWDYGSSISCNNGESFTFDVPANGTIANLS